MHPPVDVPISGLTWSPTRRIKIRSSSPARKRNPTHVPLGTKRSKQALKDGPLKDPVVTVDCYDESGVEIGFKIAFTPSLSSGSHGFQKKVEGSPPPRSLGYTNQAVHGQLNGPRPRVISA